MSDIKYRAIKASAVLETQGLPLWEKLHKSLECYGGLILDGLSVSKKRKLEQYLVGINRILAQYEIKEFNDYRIISEYHLIKALGIVIDLTEEMKEA